MTTNILVTASLAIIGNVSPYSYQVKPKTWNRETSSKQVKFNDELRASRLTKGAGKGANVRFYIYFMDGTFQHWVELTEASHTELSKNPAAVLELTKRAPTIDVVVDSTTEKGFTEVAAAPSKKAKRVKAEA